MTGAYRLRSDSCGNDARSTASMVPHPKPAPDLFLHAVHGAVFDCASVGNESESPQWCCR